jgi:transcriptional regulator of arginine metabolism
MKAGFDVTQATVSRDIRQLQLTKVPSHGFKQKYTVMSNSQVNPGKKYIRILQDGFLSVEQAGNLLVIRTVSGMAMAVAAAIDALRISGIVGCIAGDDTIFCAIKDAAMGEAMIERMEAIINRNT